MTSQKRPVFLREMPKYETIREMASRFPELGIHPLTVETFLMVVRLGTEVSGAMCASLQRRELSAGRFAVLMLLLRNEPDGLSPAELADQAGVTRATMTGLLDGLERAGLVARSQHEGDRRMLEVHLTPTGRRQLLELLPGHYQRMAALLAHLDDEEKRTLVRLLRKVAAGLPALRDP